jgi:MSHA pilin protein MshA
VNRRIEGGFTLIELVVVITILGILAAFAVPRFASLEGQARLAATEAMAGSVRSGASLAHALWLAEGNPGSTSVDMEGQPITLAFGYPVIGSIDETIVDTTGFIVTTTATTAVFTKGSAQTPPQPISNCFVTYTPPAAADEAPQIVATTNGC